MVECLSKLIMHRKVAKIFIATASSILENKKMLTKSIFENKVKHSHFYPNVACIQTEAVLNSF